MDELINRVMPHSVEAEQAVLGAMLIDARCQADVIATLRPADFYLETNRDIYETILDMFNKAQDADPVTVLDQMRRDGIATDSTSRYLVDLMNITPTAANAMAYAATVKDKSVLRAIAETSGEITELVHGGGGTAAEVLEVAEQKIFDISKGRTSGDLEPVSRVLQQAYQKITEASKRKEGEIPGLTTGLSDLDQITLGLNDSDFIVIASRPGIGKTSIALNMALAAAKESGKSVAFFSLEMGGDQLVKRLLSSESFVNTKKLSTGRLSKEEWSKLGAAAASISRTKLLISSKPAVTVSEMHAQCRRIRDLGLVVIDYLQLMTSAGETSRNAQQNRTQVVGDISRALKIMAKDLHVPVVCLAQLSREAATRRPMAHDLRESGSIEQDADIILGLHRESLYNDEVENPDETECIVLKNRHGETGIVRLLWLADYTTYTSLDRRYDTAN
ncbi:MAG: replicative DNA helicase [Oscillospiraceae bacterium]|nr:replicative DNA helicase [Oscillospiraceae bacterium]